MLIPEEDGYGPRSYLKDAARAQREYWVNEKATYWPDYGPAAPTNWYKILWVTLWVGLALGVFWLYANHAAPVTTVPSYGHVAPFVPGKTYGPTGPVTCTTTVPGGYVPAVCK